MLVFLVELWSCRLVRFVCFVLGFIALVTDASRNSFFASKQIHPVQEGERAARDHKLKEVADKGESLFLAIHVND